MCGYVGLDEDSAFLGVKAAGYKESSGFEDIFREFFGVVRDSDSVFINNAEIASVLLLEF
jgi:hypothetical protein